MPIPNHNFGAVLFLSELGLQCHLVNRAVVRLERAAAHWIKLEQSIDDGEQAPPIDIAADCAVCLSAMAAISRILYPNPRANAVVRKRSAALLQVLANLPLPNLTSVEVRNSWEHFDERLDAILVARTSGAVSELYVSSRPPKAGMIVLRRFDPVGFAIHFANDSVALRPCIEEVERLTQCVNDAFEKLKTEKVDV